MSKESRMFYNHIRKQLVYVPNTSIAERLKKHILAHPGFNSSRSFFGFCCCKLLHQQKERQVA